MRRAFEHFVGVASFFAWEHSPYVRNKFFPLSNISVILFRTAVVT